MTEQITDYSGFYINNNGRNYSKTNIHSNDKEGLYQAMWDEFCESKPDADATNKWENVLNGRYGSRQITVEKGKMKFWFQDETPNTLTGFKNAMTQILTNGQAPAYGGKRRRRSSKRGGKKRGKKSRRNTSRVR